MIGILLMVVISAIAWGIMQTVRTSSSDAYRSPNETVRLD
jgi:hypothetical protein